MFDFRHLREWSRYAIDDVKSYRQSDPNTIYLLSFPKSGVTWLKFMLIQLLIKAYDIEYEPTVDLNKLSRENKQLPKIIWTHGDSQIISEKGICNDVEQLFIYGGRLRYRKNRVILLVRDPRDVVVSHYHQVTRRSDIPLKFDSISEFVQHQHYGIQRIIRFYQVWNKNRWILRKLLIVRYEDLMTDGPTILARILNFINVNDIDSNLVNQVYEISQADKMRKLEIQGKVKGMRAFGTERNTLKVRRAKIGSYKDELSNEDIQYCNKLMKKLPTIYGYLVD
ncbi:MAG: sulfotransferase domain-containing protein [Cyanobacteria bacterium P01_D01_bin.44]